MENFSYTLYIFNGYIGTTIRNLQWAIPPFQWLLHYHYYVSVCGYAFLFVIFVISLRKGIIKYQIKQISWTVMILFIVVFQT